MDHYYYISSSKPCSLEDYYSKCSEIRSAVDEKDIQRLKLLLSLPEWYTVELDHQKILQYVIKQQNKEVFDFLLSIEDFPLDATTDKCPTALTLSLQRHGDWSCTPIKGYFASELIKKGANVHTVCQQGITLLHLVVLTRYPEVCQLLIEKGIDVNAQSERGETPLRYFYNNFKEIRHDFSAEILSILLFCGADVCPVHDPSLGADLFKLSLTFLNSPRIVPIQQVLFDYIVGLYSELEISVIDLLQFAYYYKSDKLVYDIIKHTTELLVDTSSDPCISYLFWVKRGVLKKLINKFGYVIENVLINAEFYSPFNSQSIENFEVLLTSQLYSATVEFIGALDITIAIKLFSEENDSSSVTELIYYLLSYGMVVSDRDMQFVYKSFGYGDLFKTLLHMDVCKVEDIQLDIMPAIIYDIRVSLETFLDDPHNFSINAIKQLLHFFSDQKLKEFCYSLQIFRLVHKARQLPRVPLLVELSRNASRTFLINKYKITTSKQFYTILNWLPINAYYKKIIAYEVPLY